MSGNLISETELNKQILEAERRNSSIRGDDISLFIYRTKENLENFQLISKVIAEDPILRFIPEEYSMSRDQLLKKFYQKLVRIFSLIQINDGSTLHGTLQFQEQFPLSIHFLMFVPQIKILGSDEQVKKWQNQIDTLEMIGCYAQTELGHGSDVQSLETTATYDKNTEEFIINTPSIKAAKFWPGDLGTNANHAIVVAQLIIDGVKYGVHSFLVQLRDTKTHKILEGIEVGDIGPKLSYYTKDNGYAVFKNIRIPRTNMLMRFIQVSPEGRVTRNGNEKVAYATMMLVRSMLSRMAGSYLVQALTIGIRYSIYRQQFKDDSGKEIKLMDYQLQMNKLLPNLANAFAIHFGGIKIREIVQQNQQNVQERGDFSLLSVAHCLLSGTKAFYTQTVHQGIEIVRQACGGQGFSAYSGIPSILFQHYPNVTLEGENSIMALQCSRYIIKSLKYVLSGKVIHETVDYLNQFAEVQEGNIPQISIQTINQLLNISTMQQLLRLMAVQCAIKAQNTLVESLTEGNSLLDTLNKQAGIDMVELAELHIHLFTFNCLIEVISEQKNMKNVVQAVEDIALLYGVGILLSKGMLLYELGIFSKGTQKLLENGRNELFKRIRPNALVLVEGWQFSDNSLRSAIGSSNGSYEQLFDWAKNHNSFNEFDKLPGFEELQKIRGKPYNGPLIVPKL